MEKNEPPSLTAFEEEPEPTVTRAESVAHPTGRRTGRTVASASRGPRKEAVEGRGHFIGK